MSKADILWSYDVRYPGFVDYFPRLLSGYFHLSPHTHPQVAERMGDALEKLGPGLASQALSEFANLGIFTGQPLSDDRQVRVFWTSPLMQVYRAAVSYAPRPDDDVLGAVPDPVDSAAELMQRQARYSESDFTGQDSGYWSRVLLTAAPELYLWPFLATRTGPLKGLDLGCGWGRATLGLRHFERLEMVGVDLNEEELALFAELSQRAGLAHKVKAQAADVTALPFDADCFDFAISYVVLDLLSDSALEQALLEILRCLKADSPFYVDIPTDRFCGEMMLQRQTRRGFIDLLHGLEWQGKVFQLIYHEVRIPMQFTFGIFRREDLDLNSGRRPASLVARARARLTGQDARCIDWRQQLSRRRHGRTPTEFRFAAEE